MVYYNCGGAYIGHTMGLILRIMCDGVWKRGPKSVANLKDIEEGKIL
jgi:hypothetical protein